MKNLVIVAALVFASVSASAQSQPTQCTQYPNGQIICVPIGGGPSSYR